MTDTQFDRLAELTQEAVDMLKAAIERAEATEHEVARLAGLVNDRNGEINQLRLANKGIKTQLAAVTAERDALQARIDAGVRVWGKDLGNGEWCWSYTEYHTIDTHTAILIDPKPIADHVPDAGKMMDDDRKGEADRNQPERRTGERRKGREIRCQCAECDFHPHGRKFKTCTTHHFKDNRRDPSGANERRKS